MELMKEYICGMCGMTFGYDGEKEGCRCPRCDEGTKIKEIPPIEDK